MTDALSTLTADELHVLDTYRRIRAQGQGHLFVEFVGGRVTKYEVKDGGDVVLLNSLVQRVRTAP